MTLAQAYAGQRLTASQLAAVAPLAAYKSVAQEVTSSTTLVNDSALLLPGLQANAVYHFKITLFYNGGTQGSSDIKLGFSYPSGTEMYYSLAGLTTSGAGTYGYYETQTATPGLGTNGTSTTITAVLEGVIATGSAGGTVQLQWAQNHSSSTATTVQAGSDFLAWQIQ